VAATSVGKVGSEILLDLNYEEDSKAAVDMNIVKTGTGQFVEIQGTAEDAPFSEEELAAMMAAADKGIQELIAIQRKVLGEVPLKKPKPQA
jgi:ribonuclease PH